MRGGAAVSRSRWIEVSRVEAWSRQGRRCSYCRTFLTRAQVTADHVEPRVRGGSDESYNIVAVCEPCNQAKGAMERRAFKRLLNGDDTTDFDTLLCRVTRRLVKRTDRACRRVLASVGTAG